MKDQYFGDKTDYIKYGILRAFAEQPEFPVGIHWTRTPDDGSPDGKHVAYLNNPAQWRSYDPVIFDEIRRRIYKGERRLDIVKERNFVPRSYQCFDLWSADSSERARSLVSFASGLEQNSLVFLDPDNGIEVPSAPRGSDASTRYVYFDEIDLLWQRGHSVVIYQHFPRVSRQKYIETQFCRLSKYVRVRKHAAVVTSHVAFLFCLQDRHFEPAIGTLAKIAKHWTPHISAYSAVECSGINLLASAASMTAEDSQQELPL